MNAEHSERNKAVDDLAFLRALAEGGRESLRATGAVLVTGGALYAAQCFIFGAQGYGLVHLSDLVGTVVSIGITVVFLLVLAWIGWRNRDTSDGGVVARAVGAAFGSAGTATLSMLYVFTYAALREKSSTIWFLFPCAVFALQGAAWMVAWMLRRRTWLGIVAFGWLLSAIVLSMTIGSPLYLLLAGAALVLFMALPGAMMMRPAQS